MAAVIGADRVDPTGGGACLRRSFVVAAHPFWADASKPNFSMR